MIAVLRGHGDVVQWRRLLAGRGVRRYGFGLQDGAPVGRGDGQGDRGPPRPLWRCGRAQRFSPDVARVVTASDDKTARAWGASRISKGDLFQIACAWLPDHDLTGVARDDGLTNLDPICEGDPPLPDRLPH